MENNNPSGMSDKKILVVEDDGVLRDVLIEKLKKDGYMAIGAEDGEVAIGMIATEKPDMVLLDILMPKKDGMEVLEEMHNDPVMSQIPVIVISNSGQPVEIERAKSLGARDFLVKAIFDPNEVLTKVKNILGMTKASVATGGSVSGAVAGDSPAFSGKDVQTPASGGVSAPPAAAPAQTTTAEDGGKGKVLVVEDDKFLRELLVRKLFNEGFTIESAIDSSGAFEVLANYKPQIILLDLILPGEDGFIILEKIKKDSELAAIPVIILSNLGQQEDVDRALALGAMDFMVKANFTLDEIITKITKALAS